MAAPSSNSGTTFTLQMHFAAMQAKELDGADTVRRRLPAWRDQLPRDSRVHRLAAPAAVVEHAPAADVGSGADGLIDMMRDLALADRENREFKPIDHSRPSAQPPAPPSAESRAKPHWLRSYALLRELVRDCGGTLLEDQVDSRTATSACATFVGCTNIRYRLRWDGIEDSGMLQVQAPAGTWEDVVGTRKKPTGSYTNFRALIDAAERLAGRRLD